MSNCSDHKNPLKHSGTSQGQRLPAGLKKDYVRIDEKTFADWIIFANEYAAFLNFFNLTNQNVGDWKPFFENEIATVISLFVIEDIDAYRSAIQSRLEILQDTNNTDEELLKTKLGDLFSAIFSYSKALEDLNARLPEDFSLRILIENLISSKLRSSLAKWIGYYKGAQANSLVSIA